MPITLGSNISSLMAQRALADATDSVVTTQERLASGMRINRASDDVAGLAISESLNADSKVYAQAVRNVNDGISLLNIAESAMEELSGIVVRIRELATQSANGSLDNTQRESLDEEAQALRAEFARIQQSTEFNDTALLNGETSKINIQAGYGAEAMISGSLSEGVIGGALGDGTYKSAVASNIGSTPDSVALVDLNEDGVLDIITGNSGTNDSVSVSLGNGNGSFQSETVYSMGDTVNRIVVEDFNNDGHYDVVTSNEDSNDITIRLGTGTGSFGSVQSFTTGQWPDSMAVGDLDGDNNLDIVTDNNHDWTVLFGDGNGTFQSPVTYGTGNGIADVDLVDLDNDGDLDLVASYYYGNQIRTSLNDGNGTFTHKSTMSDSSVGASALGDIDGDGVVDLISVSGGTDDDVRVRLGVGNGTFGARVSYDVGDGAGRVQLEDLNSDGMLDIVTRNGTSNDISILFGNGDGSFQDAVTYGAGAGVSEMDFGDINGDGVTDIITVDEGSNSVSVLIANTTGGVSPLEDFNLKTAGAALASFSMLDSKLETLSAQRGNVGAFQARLEIATDVLLVTGENLKIAESRIRDADIAAEAAELVRAQILQQGAAAVLAQANQQPALALTLLSQD